MFIQTKAETLDNLRGKLQTAEILPQFTIRQFDWEADRLLCLKNFELLSWSKDPLIVRSSNSLEDSKHSSLAGHYSSYQNVISRNQLSKAIDQIMGEYKNSSDCNAVFIQPMLRGLLLSGVAFTRIPPSGAPYYLINYDNSSARTDTVTAGSTNSLRTFYCHRSEELLEGTFWYSIIAFLKELEQHCRNDSLDVEFAVTQDHKFVLFQVRPLLTRSKSISEPNISAIVSTIINAKKKHFSLVGTKTIYGIMPDWNPAELIGTRPKPLAFSMFQEMITNEIWATSRAQYGYRDVRGVPLVISVGGQPYVDVRASFNSFVPKELDNTCAEKLVNYYLNKLKKHPNLHDKVEFDIVFSCFTFDLSTKLSSLENEIPGFSLSEITLLEESLINLTNRVSHFEKGLWRTSLKQLYILQQKYENTLSSSSDTLTKIRALIQDGKYYGTLSFSGLARAAFIGMQLLKSLIVKGIIDLPTYHYFLRSLQTISSELTYDLLTISKKAFLKKYGHLRPGTYDILSQRYDEAPNLYFKFPRKKHQFCRKTTPFLLTPQQSTEINHLLQIHRIHHTPKSLFDFIAAAIKGREFAKFMFTKNVSAILKLIQEHGQLHGLNREECSFLKITDILHLSSGVDHEKILKSCVDEGRQKYAATECLYLPPLIFDEKDLFSFHLFQEEPNFITSRRIRAPIAEINGKSIEEKIVFIRNADPGYDWIFSKKIAGLVTCYGGVNSHMSVRAAELNLPAIIGTGQSLYTQWLKYKILDIDCANRKVTPIK